MPGGKVADDKQFRGRLARNTLLILLLITLVPLLGLGSTAYLRTRGLLREQIFSLLNAVSQVQGAQIEDEISAGRQLLTRTIVDARVSQAMHSAMAITDRTLPEYLSARNQFFDQLQIVNQPKPYFNQFIVLDADGTIQLSTRRSWEGLELGTRSGYSTLSRQAISRVFTDFTPLYESGLVILSSVPYLSSEGELIATIIGISESTVIRELMDRAAFYTRNNYLITPGGVYYGINPYPDSIEKLIQYEPTLELNFFLEYSAAQPGKNGVNELVTFQDEPVIAAYTWLPDLQIGWLAEIPQASVYRQLDSLLIFGIMLLAAILIILGIIVWQVTRYLVLPLTQLASSVSQFSAGNWDERAQVNRDDEVGLLANSFNRMAADLSVLYRSLESKFEERTRQLQTSGDISQIGVSAANLDELLKQTVTLLATRFGYPFAAIYLLDEGSKYAVLRQVVAPGEITAKLRGKRIKVEPLTLVGWVAMSGSSKVDLIGQGSFGAIERTDLAPAARAEAGIPIIHAGKVLGVLVVQSVRATLLNEDTIKELHNLTNQISPALQNFYLLEATQIDLQETNLLYQASQQIAQEDNVSQIYSQALNTLQKTPYHSAMLVAKEDHFEIIWNSKDTITIGVPKVLKADPALVNPDPDTGPVIVYGKQKLSGLPESLSEWLQKFGGSPIAMIPVKRAGRLQTILVLGAREEDARSSLRFSTLHLQPYTNLIELLTNTLEKVNALETTRRRLSEMEILNDLSRGVAQQTNPEALFDTIFRSVSQIFGGVDFLLARYDADSHQIQVPYAIEEGRRLQVPSIPFGQGLTSLVIRSRKPLRLVTPEDWKALPAGSVAKYGKDAVSWLGAPMIVGGDVVGVIVVQDVHQSERFSQDDEKFFSTLATQLAVVFRNTILLEITRQRAYTESMVNEITGDLHRSLSIPDILATTATELGQALRVRKAKITIHPPQPGQANGAAVQSDMNNQRSPDRGSPRKSGEVAHGD